jgi:hypothetical protein
MHMLLLTLSTCHLPSTVHMYHVLDIDKASDVQAAIFRRVSNAIGRFV